MGDTTMNYSLTPTNLYKYSGKELQPELDLNTYDFGARHYNPQLARWMALDPMAETSEDFSPYNYVENNPMNLIDPDGMQPYQYGFPMGNTSAGGVFGSAGAFGLGGAAINGVFQGVNAAKAFQLKSNAVSYSSTMLRGVQQNMSLKQTTIQQWQPNGYDKWKSFPYVGKFSYGIFDDVYVAVHSVFWHFGEFTHLNGEFATPREMQNAVFSTAAGAIPLGRGSFVAKEVLENVAKESVIEAGEHAGVYDIETTTGRYVGQSNNTISRIISHFAKGGKLRESTLLKEMLHTMPGSTKLEREVYEQYLIENYGGPKGGLLFNKRNPMGGRMDLYKKMIDIVIKKFNLPR